PFTVKARRRAGRAAVSAVTSAAAPRGSHRRPRRFVRRWGGAPGDNVALPRRGPGQKRCCGGVWWSVVLFFFGETGHAGQVDLVDGFGVGVRRNHLILVDVDAGVGAVLRGRLLVGQT